MKNQTMMRNKLEKLSMAFVLAFAITSCKSDDDHPSGNNPPEVTSVKIDGNSDIGQELIATAVSEDKDKDSVTLKYKWYRADKEDGSGEKAIDGATSEKYKVVEADKDKYVTVGVTPNDKKEDGKEVKGKWIKVGIGELKSKGEPVELSGDQDKNLTLDADKEYLVTEPLNILKGATLTIPAGTTIKVKKGLNHIAILQGAKIEAKGTAEKPIIFTSAEEEPKAGDWGGIIIAGKAKTTSKSSVDLKSEIGDVIYGGDSDDDNSGTLQYVRIEYTGKSPSSKKEYNALALYSVGSGTTIDHIECYEGTDDGIEFFGGTVKVSDVALINMEDDSIDWTEGFTGSVTDAYVQFKEAKTKKDHDNGVEGDGYGAENGNQSDPIFYSNPIIENLTIKGTGTDTVEKNGMTLRVGTKGTFKNILITGVKIGVRVDSGSDEIDVCKSCIEKDEKTGECTKENPNYNATTCASQNPTAANVIDKSLHFDGIKFGDDIEEKNQLKNKTGDDTGVTPEVLFDNLGTATGADLSKFTWVTKDRISK